MSKRRAQNSSRPYRGRRHSPQARTSADNVREAAAWVVERTLETLAPSSIFLESALSRLDECDHGLLRELALGSLRWLRRIDDVLSQASDRPFEKIEPGLRGPLRIAAYQLLFLDRVPAHAAVNEGVEQARRQTHRGGASFTNAVLRRIARSPSLDDWPVREEDPLRRLAIEKSHPDFLVERWMNRFGRERTIELLDANNRPKVLQLLAFRDRGGRELLAESLIDQGVIVEPSALSPQGLVVRSGNPLHSKSYRRGDFYLQDEASQAAALIPPPRPGERILDVAAAPGGKSFTLLATEPTVDLVVADVSLERLSRLRANLKRLDRPLHVVVADAAQPAVEGPFDRVILDLPCTGTGTLRKNPELKWRISESEIGRLTRQSLRILGGSAPLVAVGGLLVTITCSLEPEENEDVMAAFLVGHPEFQLVDLKGLLPYPLEDWIVDVGSWRLPPEAEHDGFSVHVMRRSE
jgi:16S rRNA (cytosine967-C5)-methyltransferase